MEILNTACHKSERMQIRGFLLCVYPEECKCPQLLHIFQIRVANPQVLFDKLNCRPRVLKKLRMKS